jgi:hypothetical protein
VLRALPIDPPATNAVRRIMSGAQRCDAPMLAFVKNEAGSLHGFRFGSPLMSLEKLR